VGTARSAGSTQAARETKVELFLLLVSPQIGRVVNNSLDERNLRRAEQQVTDVFGSEEWRPILEDRQVGALDAEQTRDELTNLMRWRLETALNYKFTHTLRLTNLYGTPLYDMIFATDHPVGDKIMSDVYRSAAAKFPQMRREMRARQQDSNDAVCRHGGVLAQRGTSSRRPIAAEREVSAVITNAAISE
jgi:hypothetical protein